MSIANALISLTALLLLGCQPQKKDSLLGRAFEYHQQAKNTRENLDQQLRKLESTVDISVFSALEEFKNALHAWDEAWVEVPGFDHDHEEDDHEHNHHHHNQEPNLSPREHIELQKHLLEEIKGLEKSLVDIQKSWEN